MTKPSVLIIAEAGVNHNGDRAVAFELIDAAAEAGVDVVKFQTFQSEHLVTESASKAAYQKLSGCPSETQQEMLSKLELSHEVFRDLKKHTEGKGLRFMSTAFDSESLAFLSSDLQVNPLKIPSGEVTNGPLLLEFAQTGRDLILSTGMAVLDEISAALAVIAFGLLGKPIEPSPTAFGGAFKCEKGQELLRQKVTLLHCTTQYPAPLDSINLRVMETLRQKFNLRVGYSDHSAGLLVPCVATALGAEVIEKHFTLDRNLPGPDHGASLEPSELKQMVESIRSVEIILGKSEKIVKGIEASNRESARKGLVAGKNILKGDIFTIHNLAVKRPENGISPMAYWSLLGSPATRNYKFNEPILCLAEKNQSS